MHLTRQLKTTRRANRSGSNANDGIAAASLVNLACVAVIAIICSSCAPTPPTSPEGAYESQTIPVEIQRGEPLPVEIQSLSGNGANDVGIRCSPEVWNALTNGTNTMEVRLKSSNKPGTDITHVEPGGRYGFLINIPNVHYLFSIYGKHRAKAVVEVAFPNAPEGTTSADIIVWKTPIDTEL